MQVVATSPQPTLVYDVEGADSHRRRMTVFTGTVDVVPPDSGQRFRVLSNNPDGVAVGFYVGDAQPLPIAGSAVVVEASVARLRIPSGADDTIAYGITDASGTLVPAEGRTDVGWPYVTARLFGADLTMTIAYRLTVLSSPVHPSA